jgi:putative ABC transport system substrate-binding protein
MTTRRDLLAVMCLAPFAARAQQKRRIYRVGVLDTTSLRANTENFDRFRKGMEERGYVEGPGLVIAYRSAEGRTERFAELAAELVRSKVDLILTRGTPATLAAKRATSSIPIVMAAVADPVESRLAASLARPGGNVTGLTSLVPGLSQKYVELLKEAAPSTSRVAVVTGLGSPNVEIRNELLSAAQQAGIELSFFEVGAPDQIDAILTRARKSGCRAIVVPHDARTYLHRRELVQLALRHQLPGIYWSREYVEEGGLMAYGASLADLGRRAASIVDRILKGAKPADLPVEQPTKFDLVINMKSAKTLGLTVPQSLLLRADRVIE